jgi:hypothetical protein
LLHKDVQFHNQTNDDLSAEIKGRAYWVENTNSAHSAYQIKDGEYTYPIEYINGTWYKIRWYFDGKYETSHSDELQDLANLGLGTRAKPVL